jgi:hypothetical protein
VFECDGLWSNANRKKGKTLYPSYKHTGVWLAKGGCDLRASIVTMRFRLWSTDSPTAVARFSTTWAPPLFPVTQDPCSWSWWLVGVRQPPATVRLLLELHHSPLFSSYEAVPTHHWFRQNVLGRPPHCWRALAHRRAATPFCETADAWPALLRPPHIKRDLVLAQGIAAYSVRLRGII